MGKRIKGFWGKVWPTIFGPVGGKVLALLAVVGMIVWTWFAKWFTSPFAPLTLPAVLLVLSLIYIFLNQYRKFKWGKIIDYQKLIMEWLFKYGFSVQKIDKPETEWAIKSAHKEESQAPFFVFVHKTEPDFVSIFIYSQFTADQQELVDKITVQQNSTLLEELRIEMARLGCEYTGLQHPLGIVSLGQKIAKDDNFKELLFLQTVLRVRSAHGIYSNVIWKYKKLFPLPNKET